MRLRFAAFASIFVCVAVSAAQSTPAPFEFRSSFWINLHQFLIHQAAAADTAPLNPPEWRDAIAYYRREEALQDLMSRAGEAVNNSLAEAGSAAELRSDALDPNLRAVLSRA